MVGRRLRVEPRSLLEALELTRELERPDGMAGLTTANRPGFVLDESV